MNPALVVLSSLFPHAARPTAGIFIRERMFRVARELPLAVVAPQAWFPGQGLIRQWRPGYRPMGARVETVWGIDVHRPRALCIPGLARHWDGYSMAVAARGVVTRLRAEGRCDLIDAHFAYPDGYAASLVARWVGVPYTITMRGTEPRHLRDPRLRPRIVAALNGAARVFTVSNSLREVGIGAGVPAAQFEVVGNGVDTEVFHPMAREDARAQLGIAPGAKVLCTVGALVERKGFHRVIALLPRLRDRFPNLVYLAVGGGSPEGDARAALQRMVADLGVEDMVRFLGPRMPAELRLPLSASDVFVLPSSNEGWANVILEAMACGIPVVASDVGGNAEVVADETLGMIYPFDQDDRLLACLATALARQWDRALILQYARANTWDSRVRRLLAAFDAITTRALPANTPCVGLPPSGVE